MKFSQTTLLAILATSAFVAAAPTNVVVENALIKREELNDALSILEEIKSLNKKRSLADSDEAIAAISKRADSLIGNLISALANSGIVSDVFNILTTDPALRTEIGTIVKSAIQGLLVQAPALISAIFNSGLIGKVFLDFINSPDLLNALLAIAKSLFTTGLNLLTGGGSSTPATTTAAAPAAAPAPTPAPAAAPAAAPAYKRDEDLSRRDILDIAESIASDIKDSGIFQSLVLKVLANPQQSIDFLTSALKTGAVIGEDVVSWASLSGLLQEGLSYIEENGGTFASSIASFLGDQINAGNLTTADIDNAGSPSSAIAGAKVPATKTSIATTAAAGPVSIIGAGPSDAALLAAASKAEAALNSVPTTLVRRMY